MHALLWLKTHAFVSLIQLHCIHNVSRAHISAVHMHNAADDVGMKCTRNQKEKVGKSELIEYQNLIY